MTSELGKLCYKHSDGRLAFKSGGGDADKLIYKGSAGDWTLVTFAWGSDGKDLDICAYWDGASSMKMGYGYNTSKAEQVSGPYHIIYSGDERGTDTSEWVKIKMSPWSGGMRTFRIRLNYYGYNASSYPANSCAVIATQANGPSKVLTSVPCATRSGEPATATASNPGVILTFAANGTLQSMEVI